MVVSNKNFSIITSGGCNAECEFCVDSHTREASKNYIKNLIKVLDALPKQFRTCSITGGEPTLSKNLLSILALVRDRGFDRVVLTTNGARLFEVADSLGGLINHLNISRHSSFDDKNIEVFKTDRIISTAELLSVIPRLNKDGIDVTLNRVYSEVFDLDNFVKYAKSIGANAVCLRYDHRNGCVEETELEKKFSDWRRINESSCPVCRTHTILYEGMPVIFKASALEPSNSFGEIYEAIYHINGKLTSDWAGELELDFEVFSDDADEDEDMFDLGSRRSGCGGRSSDVAC